MNVNKKTSQGESREEKRTQTNLLYKFHGGTKCYAT